MHRVARELAHQECGWKHSEGHGVVALDYEGVRHVGLDKMCLLMEVRWREDEHGVTVVGRRIILRLVRHARRAPRDAGGATRRVPRAYRLRSPRRSGA